ncbi:MAG: hypothetical protein R3E86_04660 [Pseudomonadales bacterium]
MTRDEQQHLIEAWVEFSGGRPPSSRLLGEFYFTVFLELPLYRYGAAAELFDVIINGPFDAEAAVARLLGSLQDEPVSPAAGARDSASRAA